MKFDRTKTKTFAAFVLAIAMLFTVTGCGFISAVVGQIKGDLLGHDYVISEYDHYGNKTLTVLGDKVNIKAEVDSDGEPTSYIDITIDGYEWQHVGGTLVFAQNGVEMITDFEMPETIDTTGHGGTGLIPADRFVNHYRNLMGKDNIILVSSQNGVPIGLFEADDCYVDIPEDLPKMTRAHADGKEIYVHRANIDILPVGMFENRT